MLKHFTTLIFFWALVIDSAAQLRDAKPKIGLTDDFNYWERLAVGQTKISSDGKFCLYSISNANNCRNVDRLIIQGTDNSWKINLPNTSNYAVIGNNKFVIIQLPGDSLCIVDVTSRKSKFITGVVEFKVPEDTNKSLFAFRKPNGELIVMSIFRNRLLNIGKVDEFKFSSKGSDLVFISGSNVFWRSEDGVIHQIQDSIKVDKIEFNHSGKGIAIIGRRKSSKCLWFYDSTLNKSDLMVDSESIGNLEMKNLTEELLRFSDDDKVIYFKYKDIDSSKVGDLNSDFLKIYLSSKVLHNEDIRDYDMSNFACISLPHKRIQLLAKNYNPVFSKDTFRDDYFVFEDRSPELTYQIWDHRSFNKSLFLVSIKNGSKVPIVMDRPIGSYAMSPDGLYLVYFDRALRSYISINLKTKSSKNLSELVPESMENDQWDICELQHDFDYRSWYHGFVHGNQEFLIADRFDIWKVRLDGSGTPLNLTGGYGRKKGIRFGIAKVDTGEEQVNDLSKSIWLSAISSITKEQGYFILSPQKKDRLTKVAMFQEYIANTGFPRESGVSLPTHGNNIVPIKAKKSNQYLIVKMTTDESPNLYSTRDFKTFVKLSNINPEKRFNWMQSELIEYPVANGKTSQAILYKPENFNAKSRYPVIFNYYEHSSDYLNRFIYPNQSSGALNIPYYVSNGYLVCIPDIRYEIGKPSESALQHVLGAAKEIAKKSYVDSSRFGLQGHSFGGTQTNWIISKTTFFKAAVSCSGGSDLISKTLTLGKRGFGHTEQGQGRMGTTLWENMTGYIDNSPVFFADRIQTPVLIQVGNEDSSVPASQGRALYSALNRLGKKAWLLDYQNSGHLLDHEGTPDFTVRMAQFFEHYLKNTPPPKWMTHGLTGSLGFELETEIKY